MIALRMPSIFLALLLGLVVTAFLADRIRAQDAHDDDIVVVPVSVARDQLPELDIAPADVPPAVLAAPAGASQAQSAVSVEVVRRTWWDDLWGVLLPLLAAGGTYLGIWLYVQGRRLLAAIAAKDADEKRKSDESERGQAGVGLLTSIVVLAFLPLLLSQAACGSREVVAERSIGIEVKRGPPCDISLHADDKRVCRVRSNTERCNVQIDGESRP